MLANLLLPDVGPRWPLNLRTLEQGLPALTYTWNAKEPAVSQNLINLLFSDEELTTADQALGMLEFAFGGLIALDGEQRLGLNRMGGKSEQFCRQTLSVLSQNPQIVPASIGLADAQTDLATLDKLRPRLQRLKKLAERAQDTETALGSDVMSLALEGYALLKVAGRNQGLEALRKELSGRFSKSRAAVTEPAQVSSPA